jgi:glyceraldehyde-3-phosphate dehydrogenase (NADP+)
MDAAGDHLFPTAEDIPAEYRAEGGDTGLSLLIGGRLTRRAGPSQPILSAVCIRSGGRLDPLELGPGARATAADAQAAVDAATNAWAGGRGEWPRAGVEERIRYLLQFALKAAPLRERVARALMWEVGKPYPDCLSEFDRTFRYIEDTVEVLREMETDSGRPTLAGGYAARIRRAPLGATLCMGPYNYALNENLTLAIPALVMGNPIIVKTPRFGVLANALLCEAWAECFPPGVVGFLTGDGPTLVGPIMESGRVDVLALVGSSRTAGTLLRQHPRPYRLRTILGMGAKNAAVVLEDADLELAVNEIVSGALTFCGQRCTAIKHVLVDRKIADELVERLSDTISKLKVGMPWEDEVWITPMPDATHLDNLSSLVADALTKGSRLVNDGGGERVGTIFYPALVYPVKPEARLFSEEQFGPIVPVSVFDRPEEAVDIVERSRFGQQVSIFGQDRMTIGPLVDHFANLVCRVNLNTQCRRGPDVLPFTGRKDSAAGTLSVTDALRVFSIRSLVAVSTKQQSLLRDLDIDSRFLAPPRSESIARG